MAVYGRGGPAGVPLCGFLRCLRRRPRPAPRAHSAPRHRYRALVAIRSRRIEGSPGEALETVYLWLTRSEAADLRDALNDLLTDVGESWHAHVSSADYQTEVTIALDQE